MTPTKAAATAEPTETIEADEVLPPEGMTSELVPADPGAVPALINADDEWGDVDDGDLAPDTNASGIPFLQLNRKESGGILIEDTGEVVRELSFVWMARTKSRAWWKEAFGKGDAAPGCRSADGQVPLDSSPDKQSDTCTACPHSLWDGDDPPACSEAIEAMVFLPDPHGFGRLARLRFSGLAYGPSRRYWDSFGLRMPKRPPIAYVSKLTLEPTETSNGVFLVPRFERVGELSRQQAQPIIDERDRRLAEWKTDVAEHVSTGTASDLDAADTAGPGPFDGTPGDYQPGADEEPF